MLKCKSCKKNVAENEEDDYFQYCPYCGRYSTLNRVDDEVHVPISDQIKVFFAKEIPEYWAKGDSQKIKVILGVLVSLVVLPLVLLLAGVLIKLIGFVLYAIFKGLLWVLF